ncbi:diacylglycerol kinase [Nannochloropsis gaditana]|nr:diacylglycerol kinase [Nannochloropsis gaditana]
MKLIQYFGTALCVVILSCVTNIIPGGRIALGRPFSRLFGGSSRNLRAEVEAAVPHFIVPEDRVEYPTPKLAALKSKLKEIGHHKAMGHPHQHQGLDGRRRVSLHPSHRPAPSSLGAAEDKEQEEEGGEEEEEGQEGVIAPPAWKPGHMNPRDSSSDMGKATKGKPGTPSAFLPLGVPPPSLFPPSARPIRRSPWSLLFRRGLPRPRRKRPIGINRIKTLPPSVTPLIAIVNSKSGGRQGKNLFKRLRAALSRAQVFDIQKVDLKEALSLYCHLPNSCTLLVCGGDGTASRVFEVVDGMEWKHGPPKIAIVPLGTGNDIARVLDWNLGHDWSGGYFPWSNDAADANLLSVFSDLTRAMERKMDRWELRMTEAVPSSDRHRQPVKYMLGYLGIGVDGKVALDFHKLRDRAPYLFLSPTLNKFYYALMGLRDFFVRSCKNLPDKVELWCDGKPIVLPPQTESFIVLNINSHAGGVELWPEYLMGGGMEG